MKSLLTFLFVLPALGVITTTDIVTAETGAQTQVPPSAVAKPTLSSSSPAELTAAGCLICHGNFVPGKGPLAPPFAMVKMHYQSLDKETFIKTVSSWIKEPEKQKSRMPGAINRFGLMPALSYPETEVAAIARYIYETDFAMPGRGGKGPGRGQGAVAAPKDGKGCDAGCGPSDNAAPKTDEHCEAEKVVITVAPAAPKWTIPATMMTHLQSLEKDIGAFKSIASEDHANLAARTEKHLAELISSCTMEGDAHTALHEWLVPFRELAEQHSKAADPAAQQQKILEMRRAFTAFHEHFESAPQR